MTSTIICFFTLKFWIGTSRKGDEDRDWKHSTSSCSRQKPLSRLIFKRRTDAANRELDANQRWLTGQGHFRGQSDFNRGRCPSGPTPRSAPVCEWFIIKPPTNLKESLPSNESSVIIYSPSCSSKPVLTIYSVEHKNNICNQILAGI